MTPSTQIEENILRQHQSLLPQIGFSDDNFILAGQIMSAMRRKHDLEPKTRRRLTWDILIALCAQENKSIVITANEADFKKIKNWVDFQYIIVEG